MRSMSRSLLTTPSSARPAMGVLGTYGAAYSPPLRSPLPRSPPPWGGWRPRSRGGVGVGLVLGRVPCGPVGCLPLKRRRLGGVPRASDAPLRPVVSTAPSIGGQCPGAGGATWAQGGCWGLTAVLSNPAPSVAGIPAGRALGARHVGMFGV